MPAFCNHSSNPVSLSSSGCSPGNLTSYAQNTRSAASALPSPCFCRNAPEQRFRGFGETSRYFLLNTDKGITTSPLT